MQENNFQGHTPKHSEPISNEKKKKVVIIAVPSISLLVALVILCCIIFIPKKPEYPDSYKNVTSSSKEENPVNPINFDEVQKSHPDVCAWIQVDGIEIIDYPIVQSSPEADDNFYLDHDLEGNGSRAGAIYIQKLNSNKFSDHNTLIYGHNMLNGTMFGQLKKFRNADFFKENRNIYIYKPGHILKYEIISAFVYDDRHIINSFNFNIEDERKEFFDECVNPSSLTKQVLEGAELKEDDKIITLSTCTSNNSERYLVVGKLIKDTETK